MTLSFSTDIRNDRLAVISDATDAGSGPALIRIYDGVRPVSGGATTNLLAELEMSDPSFDAPSGGSMSARAISPETSTPRSGVATWFRIVDSDGRFVLDGDVGREGGDAEIQLSDTTIVVGQEVRIASMIVIDGNG